MTIHERFWAKVDKAGPCWKWVGSTNRSGYGQFRMNGKNHKAHRVSWVLANGEIPKGNHHGTACVLHKCDNPSCVNPSHLFIGSQKENIRDMDKKGRRNSGQPKGAGHWNAKLTETEVRVIRCYSQTLPTRKLSEIFGMSKMAIHRIVNNESWSNL